MPENPSDGHAEAEPSLLRRLRTHFGREPATLPAIEHAYEPQQRPTLHLALEELLDEPGRRAELFGVVLPDEYHTASLARLSRPSTGRGFDEGPVEYMDVALADERQLACVKRGIYFFHDD